MNCGLKTLPAAAHTILEEPITMDELLTAIRNRKTGKVPGRDGISLEFFKKTWESSKEEMLAVMNNMHQDGIITANQKHGIIVCIPKTLSPTRVDEYRPLTLPNTDYKILAGIITNRLRPWLPDVLQQSQFCGMQGNTVFEEAAMVRKAVAQAQTTNTPLCIISIDFKEAFDNISHTYLFALLKAYGFSEQSQQRI